MVDWYSGGTLDPYLSLWETDTKLVFSDGLLMLEVYWLVLVLDSDMAD